MGLLSVSASVRVSCDFPLAFFWGGCQLFCHILICLFFYFSYFICVCFLVRVRKPVSSRWEARWGGTEAGWWEEAGAWLCSSQDRHGLQTGDAHVSHPCQTEDGDGPSPLGDKTMNKRSQGRYRKIGFYRRL